MARSWNTKTAPAWCSGAVATTRGWVDPKTFEVLVSSRNLEGAVDHAKFISGTSTTKKVEATPIVVVDDVVATKPKVEVSLSLDQKSKPKQGNSKKKRQVF